MHNNKILHRTLPSMITNILREEIISGVLACGTQLKQEELAGRFEVSLSVLREALKALEAEGLVNIYPNKGAIVSELSAADVREIFNIRIFLETGALELSIPKITKHDIIEAENILLLADKLSNAEQQGSTLNWKFHSILYKKCESPKLLSMINSLHYNVERYMRMYLYAMHYHSKSQSEHKLLLDACEQKDIHRAQCILKAHMMDASNQLIKYISN